MTVQEQQNSPRGYRDPFEAVCDFLLANRQPVLPEKETQQLEALKKRLDAFLPRFTNRRDFDDFIRTLSHLYSRRQLSPGQPRPYHRPQPCNRLTGESYVAYVPANRVPTPTQNVIALIRKHRSALSLKIRNDKRPRIGAILRRKNAAKASPSS